VSGGLKLSMEGNEQGGFSETESKGNPFKMQFSDFEILEEIGEGSFGQVFSVRRKGQTEEYALKSMSKTKLINSDHIRYALSETQLM
jgi:serine/threonine protein kinase